MQTVTLRSATEYQNGVVKAGETREVSEAQAEDWRKRGLLHDAKGPTEQEKLRRVMPEYADARAAEEDDEPEVRVEERLVFFPGTAAQFEALSDAGYGTPDAIRAASDEELLGVKGVSEKTVRSLRDSYGQD